MIHKTTLAFLLLGLGMGHFRFSQFYYIHHSHIHNLEKDIDDKGASKTEIPACLSHNCDTSSKKIKKYEGFNMPNSDKSGFYLI